MSSAVDRRTLASLVWRGNREYFILVAALVSAGALWADYFDMPYNLALSGRFAFLTSVLGFLAFCGAAAVTLVQDRPAEPFLHIRRKMSGDWAVGERMALGLPVILATSVLFAAFTSIKRSIGIFVPNYADPMLIRIDLVIHGQDAWQFFQPVLGYPIVTYVLGLFYFLWIPLTFMLAAAIAFMREKPQLRRQYLISMALAWSILGAVVAMAFASVGPCFYSHFYDGDPFKGLFAYFDAAGKSFLMTHIDLQSLLLITSSDPTVQMGDGISAFPSMHVAIAFLNVLFAWHFGRLWRIAALVFYFLVLLGSIHLGWHYAVDGYFSTIIVFFIWKLVGRLPFAAADRRPIASLLQSRLPTKA